MQKFGIDSGGLYLADATGSEIANFNVRVLDVFYLAEDGHTPGMIRAWILHRNQQYLVDLDLRAGSLVKQIQQKVSTCRLLKRGVSSRIEAHIMELPSEIDVPSLRPPIYFSQHGFFKLVDGNWVFVAGDEVLGLSQDQKAAIAPAVARAHLACDAMASESQAVNKFWSVLEKNRETLLPVWSFTLLSAMRSLLASIDITTYPVCSVTGMQGYGKTTTCQRFSLLYDDNQRPGQRWGELDAKSSAAAAIETISRFRDQPVLLDDIAKSISPSQVRERKERLAEMLRFASNGTSREKIDRTGEVQELFCKAGLIYTGEFPIDNPSDIGRIVPVRIEKPLQNGNPQDRILAATVFRHFIVWFLPQVDESVASLKQELEPVYGDYQRLQKNRIMMLWALQKFLDFVQEVGAITEQETEQTMNKAIQVCNEMLNEQIKQTNRLETSDTLSYYILKGLRKGIVQRISEKEWQKGKRLPAYYYVHQKKNEAIYITTEVLYRYFNEKTPLRLTSIQEMDKKLIEEGILHPRKEGKAASKKIGGRRYLELRETELLRAISESLTDFV